jgi:hypothetical protein
MRGEGLQGPHRRLPAPALRGSDHTTCADTTFQPWVEPNWLLQDGGRGSYWPICDTILPTPQFGGRSPVTGPGFAISSALPTAADPAGSLGAEETWVFSALEERAGCAWPSCRSEDSDLLSF